METKDKQELQKFDPTKLMDGVRDRIKATFVSLIPDAQWEQLCNTEMEKFFQPTYGGYENKTKFPSEFEKLVLELMKENCKKHINTTLSQPKYASTTAWKTNEFNVNGMAEEQATLSDHLDAIVKEKMPEMMQSMFQNMMANAFHNFFQQMKNSGMSNY